MRWDGDEMEQKSFTPLGNRVSKACRHQGSAAKLVYVACFPVDWTNKYDDVTG
jgi:hypothetical protein